ncbi:MULTISPECIES: 5'/3'-nucleotidase SurE [unclassified Pseudodesulfovibrio]|uniref:5'/3'-nucleotidase SurE n=1 Tax=unclassified Pseudodesulfovibrio TaxID=2661612 RepID=UPI000FEBC5D5|nr:MULTISPECIES: 5'/3'-nucleotidase SurE [unclassified Pseudodesulfovibrio]MCJ2163738.1 5'/3'-nucleotidase SurE [Pseudodesulfovibrio sp. S3-i]RWU06009.1 5'/3'-nucleotidase SurE [Pseudodesulfovibrio sp. S3]
MNILLANDDGIQAIGLRSLYFALKEAGHEVNVVAPVTEQSAVGHAVTLFMPIRVKQFKENGFVGQGVYGTPVDCVKLGLTTLLSAPPDLVLSGINAGANVGVDLLYSGTVSAATEGALMEIPAMAVSMDNFNPQDMSGQAQYCTELLTRIPWAELPKKCVLNLNFPDCPIEEARELVLCPHTRASYRDWYETRQDPRGRAYYWLAGDIPPERISEGRDRVLLTKGHITLTPLHFDFTDRETLDMLRSKSL